MKKQVLFHHSIRLVVVFTFYLSSFSSLSAQEKVINLKDPLTGNQKHTARELISLKPGFTYKATDGTKFHGQIDRRLVFPPSENTYADQNGTIVGSSADGAVVGNLSGNINVSPSGAATYSVPVYCLPGINGMQPTISLEYNSQSGDGILGMCWHLGGLSMISRDTKNFFYDNERSGISWDKTSPLVLDGQRLIETNSWGSDSIEYRTEAGLDRVVGYDIKYWGPLYFKIYTKGGNVLEYGDPSSIYSYSPIISNSSSLSATKDLQHVGWRITKIHDKNNNFIEFQYLSDQTSWQGTTFFKNNRITSIAYGNETGSTREVVGKMTFEYKNKVSYPTLYIDGVAIINSYAIEKILIKDKNDKTIETYEVSYKNVDKLNYLASIKRSNASGEYFHPLTFEWSTHNYTVSDMKEMEFDGTTPSYKKYCINDTYTITKFEKIFGDITGNGVQDVLVKASYEKGRDKKHYWILYEKVNNTQYKYRYEQEWNKDEETTFLFMDNDRDGKDELYIGWARSDKMYILSCYKYTNSSIHYVEDSYMIPLSTDAYNNRKNLYALPGDFSGAGQNQILLFINRNQLIGFSGIQNAISPAIGGGAGSKIFLTDFNGNGKTELMYVDGGGAKFYEYNTSTKKFELIYTATGITRAYDIYPGDFNGDGNTDMIVVNRSAGKKAILWESTGKDLEETNYAARLPFNPYIRVLDINQDGKSDVVVTGYTSVGNTITSDYLKIFISTSTGFEEKYTNDKFNHTYGMQYGGCGKFEDLNSKGVSVFDPFEKINFKYIAISKNVQFNKITGITDSFREKTTITYQPVKSQWNGKPGFLNFEDDKPQENLFSSLPAEFEVVRKISGTYLNNEYSFSEPYINWKGKGFQGFRFTTVTDNLNKLIATREGKINTARGILYPYRTQVTTTTGTKVSEERSVYTITNNTVGISTLYYMRLDSMVQEDFLKGTKVSKAYTVYDTDKNPKTITTRYDNGIYQVEAVTYTQGNHWCTNKINSIVTRCYAPGESTVTRNKFYTYDTKDRVVTETTDKDLYNSKVITYSNYDKYGNPQTISLKTGNVTRTSSATYTSSGRFIKSKKNHLNETEEYEYDEARGLVKNKTNRLGKISYQYDGFGRLVSITYPDGTKTANALQWAGNISSKPSGAVFYLYTENSGETPVITWYNGKGKELRAVTTGLGNKEIWQDKTYQANGALAEVSEPYFKNTTKKAAETYTYDAYGRPQTIATPLEKITYTYTGLTTKIAAPGKTTEITTNAAGWVTEEKNMGKAVTFKHYATGQVKEALPQNGVAVKMEYDLQGNRTKITDPDAGVTRSAYNGFGELLWTKQKIHADKDTITTTHTYKTNGLLEKTVINGATTSYTYDSSNRLTKVSISGKHEKVFTYGNYDRISQVNEKIEGREYIRKFTYDQLGRVEKETYPSQYTITNLYDTYGNLVEVKDYSGRSIRKAVEENAKGQLVKENKGGKVTTYGYDQYNLPSSLVAPGVIDMGFSFNSTGMLSSRTDNRIKNKETFSYSDRRLYYFSIYKNDIVSVANSLAFDNKTGNITSKADAGYREMKYGEGNGKPHALTSYTLSPASTNIPTENLTVNYNDFGKVTSLKEGSKTYDLAYGVDKQRIKSTYKENNALKQTRYYLGDYEEEVDSKGNVRKIHYLGHGGIYIQNNGKDSLLYAYSDYLGSLTALTDQHGNVLERYAYGPWGVRRNPDDWTKKRRTEVFKNKSWIHGA